MPAAMSSLATKYVRVAVYADANPTTDTVEMAFLTTGKPIDTDWVTGLWDSSVTSSPYRALVLVGPGTGGKSLAVGTYAVWLRITDDPEIPVDPTGDLIIF